MIPPSEMATGLYRMFATGQILPDLRSTMVGVVIALSRQSYRDSWPGPLSTGFRASGRTLDPFFASYYAIPIWAFYPLFVFLFGLNDYPKVVIAYLYAVVAMIVNTLSGLDRMPRVYRKTAQVLGMSGPATAFHIVLPAAAPYVFTGVKLAIAYSFIGVVGSEFILATSGLGYRIGFAYTTSTTRALLDHPPHPDLSVTINMSLFYWEKVLMKRGDWHERLERAELRPPVARRGILIAGVLVMWQIMHLLAGSTARVVPGCDHGASLPAGLDRHVLGACRADDVGVRHRARDLHRRRAGDGTRLRLEPAPR